ncbi:MAG TPA: glycosyltransferase family 87 protein [Candidatus Omnitrophota bacterium]|nr:glycosyltransferase family 87 protein [Candidatus Omnitrophota bacterium]HPS36841.1 glycosyltransferase family 87 protein [Candidatus Omnitrophota bacterium]
MDLLRRILEFFFRKKWPGVLALAVFFFAVGASTFYRGAVSPKQRTDLPVFLKAGETVAEGRPGFMYETVSKRGWHYVYSPLLAILLAPVSKWPLSASVSLAYLFSIACLAGTVWLSRKLPEKTGCQNQANVSASPGCRPAPWQISLAILLCLPIILNTLTRGQFGVVTLFFMAAVFYSYLKQHKILTGLLLAFAVTLKISPLAFLVFFFLIKREWRVLASTLVGFGLFFFLIPSLAVGFHQNLELLKTWRHLMSISQSATAYQHYLWDELFTPFAADNQSLYAVITRFIWHSSEHFARRYNVSVLIITSPLSLTLFVLSLLSTRNTRSPKTHDSLKLLAEFSLFPMLMLFSSPVTQIHHYTIVYFLFLAALTMTERHPHGSWSRRFLLLAFWICAFSLTMGMIFPWAGFLGFPLWGSMFLWLVVLFNLKSNSSSAS